MENSSDEQYTVPVAAAASKHTPMYIIIAIFIAVILVVAVAVLVYAYYVGGRAPGYLAPESSTSGMVAPEVKDEVLLSQEYRQALDARLRGDDVGARRTFETLLAKAVTPEAHAQLGYQIALTETYDNPTAAIQRLKGIIADPQAPVNQRAYSAQRLGLMYYRLSDPALADELFSGSPYESFKAEGDVLLAVRRLFEYCSSIFPLGICEMRSAMWYTKELLKAKEDNNETALAALSAEYLPILEKNFAAADKDITRTSGLPEERTLIPEILYLKALNYSRLYLAGFDYEYEPAMKTALESALMYGGGADGQARYAYAVALLHEEDDRTADAYTVIKPMLTDIAGYPAFQRMFAAEKSDVFGEKENVLLLASEFPDFKQLLVSLGWTEADFSPRP